MITFRSESFGFSLSFDPYYQTLLMLSFSHFIPLTEDWNHIQGCACVCEKETETEMERERESWKTLQPWTLYKWEIRTWSFFLCTPDQLSKQDNSTLGWINRGKISRTRKKTCSALWCSVIPGILRSTKTNKQTKHYRRLFKEMPRKTMGVKNISNY